MPKQPETKHWYRHVEQAIEAAARQNFYEPHMNARQRNDVRYMMNSSRNPVAREWSRQRDIIPFDMRIPREHPDVVRLYRAAPEPKPLKRLSGGRRRRRRTTVKRLGRGRRRAAPKRRKPVRRGTGRRRVYRRRRR